MAVIFVYNGHYILMVLSLNETYVCMSYHIFRPFTEDVFKWMPVDVYIGGNEHGIIGMYPVSN